MDKFEQRDLEKETNDSRNTCYQNAVCYKEKENAFIKNCRVYSLSSGKGKMFPCPACHAFTPRVNEWKN